MQQQEALSAKRDLLLIPGGRPVVRIAPLRLKLLMMAFFLSRPARHAILLTALHPLLLLHACFFPIGEYVEECARAFSHDASRRCRHCASSWDGRCPYESEESDSLDTYLLDV